MIKSKGFTLMELMVVIAIIGILSAVAIPAYNNSTTKTRRAEGKSLLLAAAQRQEQNFTENNQYATNITTDNPPTQILLTTTSTNGYYTLTISGASSTAFTLNATPVAPHSDSECGTITLDNLGSKGEGGTGTVADCW